MVLDATKRWLRGAPLALLVVTAAACGDDPAGPGSDDPFDPEQSSEDFAAMQSALEANTDVADDLAYVSVALESMPTAAWVFESPEAVVESPLIRPVALPPLHSMGSAQPLLPADVLGTTFEWDEVESGYVASERAGAPANGVRFLLYDRTTVPPTENGFVDITDESDPSADRLSVHLEKNGVTRLAYDVEVVETTSGGTIGVSGYLTDGTDRLDFDLLESVAETADGFQIDVDYSVSLAGQPLSVDLDYTIDFGTTLGASLTATFVNGANTLVLVMSQEGEDTLEGSVEWNGDLVMTITDDGTGEPLFLGPEGEELTAAEAQAISEMFEIAMGGLDFLAAYIVLLGGGVA